jgi:hypothetical protein
VEEQNPTPTEGGASTLDRLERYLAAQDNPDQPNPAEPSQEAQPDDGAASNPEPTEGATDESQPQLTTSDLAKFLGVDEAMLDLDEDGTVKFKTKIDGQDGAAKLADFIKTYQIQGHAENKAREVARQEEAMRARQQEAEQQFAQQLQYAQGLANVAANQLMREFQSVDCVTLESTEPGQAALLRQKFQERQAELRGVFDHIQQQTAQQEAARTQERQKFLQAEAARLPELIPEWKDEAVATKEQREIREWALKQGFQAQEIDAVERASHLAVLRKAMQFDKLQQAKPAIENKVRNAPVLVKPGQPVQNTQAMKLQNLKTAVKKSGGKNDAIEAYLLATGRA